MNNIYCLLLSAFLLTQISAFQKAKSPCLKQDPPKTVPYVNITRYLGIWYEQASIPASFSLNCTSSFANYSLNQDQTIRVINTCLQDGLKREVVGFAYPDPEDTEHTNAKLKVKFPTSPVAGDYWVVRLDESYSYAVVGGPTYAYLWILYRSQVIPDELYNFLYQDLKKDGFPVEKLKRNQP